MNIKIVISAKGEFAIIATPSRLSSTHNKIEAAWKFVEPSKGQSIEYERGKATNKIRVVSSTKCKALALQESQRPLGFSPGTLDLVSVSLSKRIIFKLNIEEKIVQEESSESFGIDSISLGRLQRFIEDTSWLQIGVRKFTDSECILEGFFENSLVQVKLIKPEITKKEFPPDSVTAHKIERPSLSLKLVFKPDEDERKFSQFNKGSPDDFSFVIFDGGKRYFCQFWNTFGFIEKTWVMANQSGSYVAVYNRESKETQIYQRGSLIKTFSKLSFVPVGWNSSDLVVFNHISGFLSIFDMHALNTKKVLCSFSLSQRLWLKRVLLSPSWLHFGVEECSDIRIGLIGYLAKQIVSLNIDIAPNLLEITPVPPFPDDSTVWVMENYGLIDKSKEKTTQDKLREIDSSILARQCKNYRLKTDKNNDEVFKAIANRDQESKWQLLKSEDPKWEMEKSIFESVLEVPVRQQIFLSGSTSKTISNHRTRWTLINEFDPARAFLGPLRPDIIQKMKEPSEGLLKMLEVELFWKNVIMIPMLPIVLKNKKIQKNINGNVYSVTFSENTYTWEQFLKQLVTQRLSQEYQILVESNTMLQEAPLYRQVSYRLQLGNQLHTISMEHNNVRVISSNHTNKVSVRGQKIEQCKDHAAPCTYCYMVYDKILGRFVKKMVKFQPFEPLSWNEFDIQIGQEIREGETNGTLAEKFKARRRTFMLIDEPSAEEKESCEERFQKFIEKVNEYLKKGNVSLRIPFDSTKKLFRVKQPLKQILIKSMNFIPESPHFDCLIMEHDTSFHQRRVFKMVMILSTDFL